MTVPVNPVAYEALLHAAEVLLTEHGSDLRREALQCVVPLDVAEVGDRYLVADELLSISVEIRQHERVSVRVDMDA